MEKCASCVHYQNFLFSRPVCGRISNINIKTQKNTPFKVYEAYRICKGYFYEPCKDDSSGDVKQNVRRDIEESKEELR